MDTQEDVVNKGGTMRLGHYHPFRATVRNCILYGESLIYERHRHRYEFNNDYKAQFESNGLVFSGICPDNNLVEVIENQIILFMACSIT